MKKLENGMLGIVIVIALELLVGTVSSCSATRSGCPDTQGFVGYR